MVPPPVGGLAEAVAQIRVKAAKAASLRVTVLTAGQIIWIIVFMCLFPFTIFLQDLPAEVGKNFPT